jgi:hypothetical protein
MISVHHRPSMFRDRVGRHEGEHPDTDRGRDERGINLAFVLASAIALPAPQGSFFSCATEDHRRPGGG